MADYKKYKIGITPKGAYDPSVEYEFLDLVLYDTVNGGDGCSYVALETSTGVTPGTDNTVWMKSTQTGLSIYDLAVKYGHFSGTEEEFEAEYQEALSAATSAAASANAVARGIEQAENLRAQAEQVRVSSEATRVAQEASRNNSESNRASAETARATAETSRNTAETARITAEVARSTADTERSVAEAARVAAETARETQADSDHNRAETDHSIAQGDHERIADKADINGYYENMAVGIAKNLEGRNDVTESFFERPVGSYTDVTDGLAQLTEVKGKSQVWNQLMQMTSMPNTYTKSGITLTFNDNGTITASGTYFGQETGDSNMFYPNFSLVPVISNHKYYLTGGSEHLSVSSYRNLAAQLVPPVKKGIYTASGDGNTTIYHRGVFQNGVTYNETLYPNIIDLTLLGIDNLTTVEEVEAWLAENIGEQAYYPYNPGEVLNNRMVGVESIGFNLLDPVTGKANIIGTYSNVYDSYYGITGTHGALTFTDKFGNSETVTPDSDGKFLLEKAGTLSVADAGADCAVFLWWDGTQTEYKPYEKNEGKLDVTHIYGKLNGTGDYVQVWPTGMPGIGDIKDSLKVVDGEVVAERKVGEVDMGTLTYMDFNEQGNYYANIVNKSNRNRLVNVICGKYQSHSVNGSDASILVQMSNRTITGYYNPSSANSWLYVKDADYTDAASLKTSLDGVPLYYELVTPVVYTNLIYQNSELFADGTPVTLPVNYKVDNWGIELVIPQNTDEAVVTTKPELTMRYSIDAVQMLKTQEAEIQNINEELNEKPVKNGDYPEMSVGTARNLYAKDSKPSEFVFDALPSGIEEGPATIDSVKGKSLVWNQLVENGNFADGVSGWSATNTEYPVSVSDGVLTWVAQTDGTSGSGNISRRVSFTIGHKHLIMFETKASEETIMNAALGAVAGGGSWSLSAPRVGTSWTRLCGFSNPVTATNAPSLHIRPNSNTTPISGLEVKFRNIMVIDLTLMFGAGNEPTAVSEFEAMFRLPYYDYNPGEIISNKTEEVKVVGFNLWDEEWESGTVGINAGGGDFAAVKANNTTQIRTKNWIEVVPGKTYRFSCLTANYGGFYVVGASYIIDEGHGVSIAANPILARNGGETLTIPSWCHYILFSMAAAYGTTYKNDICVNLSDPARNGTYEPYKTNTIELNLPTLTGKLNGEGESVVVFPDGLKSAGSVYDEIVGNKAIKRVGKKVFDGTEIIINAGNDTNGHFRYDVTYIKPQLQSSQIQQGIISSHYTVKTGVWSASFNDQMSIGGHPTLATLYFYNGSNITTVAEFRSWLATQYSAGTPVVVYYELATPEEYILDIPIPDTFQAYKGGTIKQLPENTSEPVTAPMVMSATYSMDAVSTLNNLPPNYMSKESMQAFLSAMQLAGLISSYTMTYNESTGRYQFTIVKNS